VPLPANIATPLSLRWERLRIRRGQRSSESLLHLSSFKCSSRIVALLLYICSNIAKSTTRRDFHRKHVHLLSPLLPFLCHPQQPLPPQRPQRPHHPRYLLHRLHHRPCPSSRDNKKCPPLHLHAGSGVGALVRAMYVPLAPPPPPPLALQTLESTASLHHSVS